MNRTELQRLADIRIDEAKLLLDHGKWSGAYYLAGYAVECGLKACVLAHVELTGVIFQDRKYSEKCWTHDSEELVKLAGLKTQRDADAAANAALWTNWSYVKDWKESSRYEEKTQADAERLYHAIVDAANGVLPWIKSHW